MLLQRYAITVLAFAAVTIASPSARAGCIELNEMPWFWPPDGATDVPTNAKVFAHAFVQEAFLDGEPMALLSPGVFDPGPLAAGSTYVLRLVTDTVQAETTFTTGEASAGPPPLNSAQIEDVFVVSPEASLEDGLDPRCFVDATGRCLDDCTVVYIRARVADPNAFGWWIEAHSQAGFVPTGCGQHLYIPICRPSHESPQACLRIEALSEGDIRTGEPEFCVSVPQCLYDQGTEDTCDAAEEDDQPAPSSGGCGLAAEPRWAEFYLFLAVPVFLLSRRRRRTSSRATG